MMLRKLMLLNLFITAQSIINNIEAVYRFDKSAILEAFKKCEVSPYNLVLGHEADLNEVMTILQWRASDVYDQSPMADKMVRKQKILDASPCVAFELLKVSRERELYDTSAKNDLDKETSRQHLVDALALQEIAAKRIAKVLPEYPHDRYPKFLRCIRKSVADNTLDKYKINECVDRSGYWARKGLKTAEIVLELSRKCE